MGSEVGMRDTMRKHFLKAYPTGHWTRIEDTCQSGVPDIIFVAPSVIETWVEAKNLEPEKLPKRPTTPVKFGLKLEQRIWLDTHRRAGGRVMIAVKCGREWFVFMDHFLKVYEGRPLQELRKLATYHWVGNFDLSKITGVSNGVGQEQGA